MKVGPSSLQYCHNMKKTNCVIIFRDVTDHAISLAKNIIAKLPKSHLVFNVSNMTKTKPI